MSLILDALKRSEQERPDAEPVPGLQTVHSSAGENVSQDRMLWVWPALTLVLAGVALALWLNGGSGSEPGLATQAAPEQGPEQVPDQVPEQVPEQALDQVARPVPAATSTVPVSAAGSETMPPQALAPPTRPAADQSVAALYAQAPVVSPPPPQESQPAVRQLPAQPGLDVDALARAAEAALNQKPVLEHSAPLIADLKQSTKDEIPSIFFTAHRWSSASAQSEVVLNGAVFKQGDTVKPGLKLVEILKDSIVLDYRGTEFRLRSLNSWVNL
jgi:general secretion pathway protein B